MSLSIGNNTIGSVYLGSTKISEAYIGSTKVFSSAPAVQYPYLLIEFSNASYTPTLTLLYTPFRSTCTWTQESSSPNLWKLEIHEWNLDNFGLYGLSYLFRPNGDSGNASLTMDCNLVGSYNMDAQLDGHYCQTFDRMFSGCTGLQSIVSPIHCITVQNVGNMFGGCTNVQSGALTQYNWFSTYGFNINNHSGTFSDCGSNTAAGAAELAQIPVGWGGTLVPTSTLMTSSRTNAFGTYTTWEITDNAPDWTNIIGLYLFTEASVSAYAGVSMNRSRITTRNSLNTSMVNALYFYPAFIQYTGSSSTRVLTWVATTDTPNGNLTSGQGNTDMPGTLDYSTYGTITRTYGTFDSTKSVHFLFLVTNVPINEWQGLSSAYGILYNSNFKTDGGFRYFY